MSDSALPTVIGLLERVSELEGRVHLIELNNTQAGSAKVSALLAQYVDQIEKLRELVGFHEADAKLERKRRDEAAQEVIRLREVITMTNTDKLNERIAFLEMARKAACGHLEKVLKVDGGQSVVDAARLWLFSAEANA